MKPTSGSSQRANKDLSGKRPRIGVIRVTDEQRVMACLKACGARPMSAATRKRLAASGNLGMPDE